LAEVVDTRFFIEHFYSMENEKKIKTSRKLKELIQRKEGLLPTIVLSEIIRFTCEKRGREEAEARYLTLLGSGLQIQDLDRSIAKQAGLLKCRYRDISMGDCIIASTAIINKARVLSDDPHFDIIEETQRTWI